MNNQFENETKALQIKVADLPEINSEHELAGVTVLQGSIQALIRGIKTVLEPKKTEAHNKYKQAKADLDSAIHPLEALKKALSQKKLSYGQRVEAENLRKREEVERKQREANKKAEDERLEKMKRINERAEEFAAAGRAEQAAKLAERAKEVEAEMVMPAPAEPMSAPVVPAIKYRIISTAVVDDITKVPREWLIIDQAKINAAAREVQADMSASKIPGIRFVHTKKAR